MRFLTPEIQYKMFKFNYHEITNFVKNQVIFWPDLASAHYANATLQFLDENGITYVPRDQNPPNAPQIRPIENFFGILKQHVYAGNWSANSREALIRRIKKCIKEIKMFNNLKPKIHQAMENGLDSLL